MRELHDRPSGARPGAPLAPSPEGRCGQLCLGQGRAHAQVAPAPGTRATPAS